jgi:hypothetical protein
MHSVNMIFFMCPLFRAETVTPKGCQPFSFPLDNWISRHDFNQMFPFALRTEGVYFNDFPAGGEILTEHTPFYSLSRVLMYFKRSIEVLDFRKNLIRVNLRGSSIQDNFSIPIRTGGVLGVTQGSRCSSRETSKAMGAAFGRGSCAPAIWDQKVWVHRP